MGNKLGVEKSAAKKIGVSLEEWRQHRDDGEAWCYCCREWKMSEHFGVDKSRSTKRASSCKVCVSHKGTASRYRIGVEAARTLRSGKCVCDICGRDQKLEVDHNHTTGEVRGMLCSRCNGALGHFCDDVDLLRKAILYLQNGSR